METQIDPIRDKRVPVLFTADERAAIDKAASAAGLSLSSYIRMTALAKARSNED